MHKSIPKVLRVTTSRFNSGDFFLNIAHHHTKNSDKNGTIILLRVFNHILHTKIGIIFKKFMLNYYLNNNKLILLC